MEVKEISTVTIGQLQEALQSSWSAETSYTPSEFSQQNPSRGQCVISSLIIQDYLGGELVKVAVRGDGVDEKHYYNIFNDGTEFDATSGQYDGMDVVFTPASADLQDGKYLSVREKRLSDDETRRRYDILRE